MSIRPARVAKTQLPPASKARSSDGTGSSSGLKVPAFTGSASSFRSAANKSLVFAGSGRGNDVDVFRRPDLTVVGDGETSDDDEFDVVVDERS